MTAAYSDNAEPDDGYRRTVLPPDEAERLLRMTAEARALDLVHMLESALQGEHDWRACASRLLREISNGIAHPQETP